jgi:hypothetical protein
MAEWDRERLSMAKRLAMLKCGCEDWIALRPDFLGWHIFDAPAPKVLRAACGSEVTELHFKSLIIATARERLLPFLDGLCRTCSALVGYRRWSKRDCQSEANVWLLLEQVRC